ncbi:MAG: tail fiber domain-containing protein [Patescibacteria group bacterium]|nr:tail fiber domain-containing protein [Patescibacteria group bacterium]
MQIKTTKIIILSAVAFIIYFSLVSAWTGPTANPPSSNTSEPLNVGANFQLKQGSLQSNTDMRSPVYYDYPSTSYYIDPSSTSYTNKLGSFYLANNYGVSTDHPYGMYFASGMSSAYAIYRESGSWTSPYPDLRIAFHTGIKLGANASYNGIRFYNDYNMSTLVMSVNDSATSGANNVYIPNTLKVGTINLGGVSLSAWPSGADNLGNHSATQDLDMNNHAVKEVSVLRLNNGFELQQGGSNYGRLGSWLDVRGYGLYSTSVNGAHFYPNTSSNYGSWQISGTRGGWSGMNYANYVTLMMHSSHIGGYNDRDNEWIYYGTRNGPFYAMYNGATRLTTTSAGVTVGGTLTASNVVSGGQNVCRQNGTYCPSSSDDQTLNEVLAQGNSAGNREMVNVNGIRLGSASSPGSWQIYGSGNMYTAGYFRADASMRAPIFYDQNNIGYYVDPASTSILSRIYAYNDLYVGSSSSDNTSDIYIADKIHDWDNTGYYLDPASTSRLNTVAADRVYGYSDIRSPIFYDYNDTNYYANPASTSRFNALTVNGITLGGVYRSSWPSAGITSESDTLATVTARGSSATYVYRSYGYNGREYDANSTSYYVDPSSVSAFSDLRATIFRDRNNPSSYLLDMDGTSYLNILYLNGISVSGQYLTSIQKKLTGACSVGQVVQNINSAQGTFSCVNAGSGDITAVVAGTGLTGGGTSDSVTLTLTTSSPHYATKFVDSDYHAYYLDPASTNRLNYIVSDNIYNYGHLTTGSYTISSDIRLKKDIAELDSSLSKILQLKGVSFKWKDEEARGDSVNIGLIAQDVEKVYPELVMTDEETGLKSIQYSNLVAPLIEAIKEQQKQIDELKNEIKLLKSK